MEIPTPVQEQKLEGTSINVEGPVNPDIPLEQTFTPLEKFPGDYAQVAALMHQISQTSDPEAKQIREMQKDPDSEEPLTFIEILADIITRFFARFQRKQI